MILPKNRSKKTYRNLVTFFAKWKLLEAKVPESLCFSCLVSCGGSGFTDLLQGVVLQCADAPETHLQTTGTRRIYHCFINTSASSFSPCHPPLINQQSSPWGCALQLSSLSVCISVWIYTLCGHPVCICMWGHAWLIMYLCKNE